MMIQRKKKEKSLSVFIFPGYESTIVDGIPVTSDIASLCSRFASSSCSIGLWLEEMT